mgnify:CR=1 FL=1
MDLKEIRRIVIIALFSDDELMEKFVLKGGNALDIIHSIGTRSSVDVDLSMSGDFADLEDAKKRIFKGLRDRFDAVGFVVFDETLSQSLHAFVSGKTRAGAATLSNSRSLLAPSTKSITTTRQHCKETLLL